MRYRGAGRRIIAGVVLIGAAFIGTTWWALEWSGVALVQTEAPDGEVRTTRVWHAKYEGEIWLEAGSAESPWYRDLEHSRAVVLTIDGESLGYWAEPLPNPAGHERIRKLLRNRYGLRDRWIELILDMSGTIAVRLSMMESHSGGGSQNAARWRAHPFRLLGRVPDSWRQRGRAARRWGAGVSPHL